MEDNLEKATREDRQGLDLDLIPDADLFFVDKVRGRPLEEGQGGVHCAGLPANVRLVEAAVSRNVAPAPGAQGPAEAAAPAAGDAAAPAPRRLSRKEVARSKVLRSAAILAGAHSARPVAKPVNKRQRGVLPPAKRGLTAPAATAALAAASAAGAARRRAAAVPPADADLWTEFPAAVHPATLQAEVAVAPDGQRVMQPNRKRQREGVAVPRPAIAALEVDAPGCSFNPGREAHQEAMAVAVAAEMAKIYRRVRRSGRHQQGRGALAAAWHAAVVAAGTPTPLSHSSARGVAETRQGG